MKRVDILGVLLDACELWDKNWKDESVERARLIRDAPDEAPKDTRIMEEEYADEHKVMRGFGEKMLCLAFFSFNSMYPEKKYEPASKLI